MKVSVHFEKSWEIDFYKLKINVSRALKMDIHARQLNFVATLKNDTKYEVCGLHFERSKRLCFKADLRFEE